MNLLRIFNRYIQKKTAENKHEYRNTPEHDKHKVGRFIGEIYHLNATLFYKFPNFTREQSGSSREQNVYRKKYKYKESLNIHRLMIHQNKEAH